MALIAASLLSGIIESVLLTLVAQVSAALVNSAGDVHLALGPLRGTFTINTLLLLGIALAVMRSILMVPLAILPARISADVQWRLRQTLFTAFTRAAWSVQSRDREGQLQELVGNQVGQATGGALSATQLVTAILTILTLVVSALVLNALAAVFVVATTVALFFLLRPLNDLAARRARAFSQAQMNLAHGVVEATRMAEETHAFGVADAQQERMHALLTPARALFYRTQMLNNFVPNLYRSLVYVLVVGGLLILSGSHTRHVAALGAVVLLLVRAAGYGQAAQGAYGGLRQSLPFVDRLHEAVERYTASRPRTGSVRLGAVESLAFSHVTFGYVPERPVLTDVSFEVHSGEAIGLVGPSGAGKSTLVQILLRLRAQDNGRYLVNGIAAEDIIEDDWRARFAYVPQASQLVHASVAENIRYFRSIEDAEVERAARLARIHDDIVSWSQGYDTIIGPRADAVSGGQQQRICIARALAARPAVLILDEPTSALDPRSERLLQESLEGMRATLTLFIIAHRLSTLDACDRIMVIEHGRLAAFDTPLRLKQQSTYFRFATALVGTPN